MSDARCAEFLELVSAYVDERLDGDEMLRLEEHYQVCSGCRTFETETRRVQGLLLAAEAFRPLRRPPPGFAAMVVARAGLPAPARVVPFPEVRAGQRRARAPWLGLVAAAAAAALLFTWSWQRLLTAAPEQKMVSTAAVPTVDVAATSGGSMDTWMREHAMLARGGTLLGSAEESENARINVGVVQER